MRETVEVSPTGVRVCLDASEMSVPWEEITEIYGWLLKTPISDVVYVIFVHESANALEVHNSMNGWEVLLSSLAVYVPEIVANVPSVIGNLSKSGDTVVLFKRQ